MTRVGSAEAGLSALSLSGDGGEVVELEPSFSGARTAYTASVGNEVSAVTVSATLADESAAFEVRVNGVEVEEDDVVSFKPPILYRQSSIVSSTESVSPPYHPWRCSNAESSSPASP